MMVTYANKALKWYSNLAIQDVRVLRACVPPTLLLPFTCNFSSEFIPMHEIMRVLKYFLL